MAERVENMWNDFSIRDRWAFINRLGLSSKIKFIDKRLFEELPQRIQRDILHTSEAVKI